MTRSRSHSGFVDPLDPKSLPGLTRSLTCANDAVERLGVVVGSYTVCYNMEYERIVPVSSFEISSDSCIRLAACLMRSK